MEKEHIKLSHKTTKRQKDQTTKRPNDQGNDKTATTKARTDSVDLYEKMSTTAMNKPAADVIVDVVGDVMSKKDIVESIVESKAVAKKREYSTTGSGFVAMMESSLV